MSTATATATTTATATASSFQSIRFCVKCDNKYYHRMFYPTSDTGKEQTDDPVLLYYCRVCGYVDKDLQQQGMCVLDTQKYNNVDMFAHMYNEYTKHDPTLPHIFLPCPNDNCTTNSDQKGVTDAVYLRYNQDDMKYLYVCTVCEHKWKNE